MKVRNVHSRKIRDPHRRLRELFATLATKADKIWPVEDWPAMRLNRGLAIGSSGGHGPIRYAVVDYRPARCVRFRFQQPAGFVGFHEFEIREVDADFVELSHTLAMDTTGTATLYWSLVIRWLHDALIANALDKVENQLTGSHRKTEWSAWVKLWRWILSSRG